MEQGYHQERGHKSQHYPDSKKESQKVARAMANPDMEYFLLTDKSPRTAFIQYLENQNLSYRPEELEYIVQESLPVILSLKNYYNRPRPAQVNPDIKAQPSETAQTPAYPSGHATQSYMIAKYLAKQHPLHYLQFYRIAHRIAKARVKAGLHYPSDNHKAFEIAHNF